MAQQATEIKVEASSTVRVPVEHACPECEADMFGHVDGSQAGYWLPDTIEGTLAAYRTDDGEIAYRLTIECLNCGHELREEGLTSDDIEVVENDD